MLELSEQRRAALIQAAKDFQWIVNKMTKGEPKRLPSLVEANLIGRLIQQVGLAKKAVEPYEGWGA